MEVAIVLVVVFVFLLFVVVGLFQQCTNVSCKNPWHGSCCNTCCDTCCDIWCYCDDSDSLEDIINDETEPVNGEDNHQMHETDEDNRMKELDNERDEDIISAFTEGVEDEKDEEDEEYEIYDEYIELDENGVVLEGVIYLPGSLPYNQSILEIDEQYEQTDDDDETVIKMEETFFL